MQKRTISMATLFLVLGLLPTGSPMAQDAPATKPTPAPAPAAKPAQTPGVKSSQTAAKPGQGATARKPAPAPLVLKTPKDKASYAIGLNIGKSLQKDSVDVDPNILLRGLKDVLAGGKTLLTDDEAKAAMVAIQADLRKKQEAKMGVVGDANKKDGDAFLAVNKTKE